MNNKEITQKLHQVQCHECKICAQIPYLHSPSLPFTCQSHYSPSHLCYVFPRVPLHGVQQLRNGVRHVGAAVASVGAEQRGVLDRDVGERVTAGHLTDSPRDFGCDLTGGVGVVTRC